MVTSRMRIRLEREKLSSCHLGKACNNQVLKSGVWSVICGVIVVIVSYIYFTYLYYSTVCPMICTIQCSAVSIQCCLHWFHPVYTGFIPCADTPGIRLPIDFAIFYQISHSTSSTEGYS